MYVGRDPGPVVDLPNHDAGPCFLASVAPDVDVAVTSLTSGEIDCVVCDESALDADGWAFLHRLADRPRDLPVVLLTSDATAVPDELYADAVPGDDVAEVASTVTATVRETSPATPAGDTAAALLERAEEYVAHVDRDGTVRMVNASAAERLGLSRTDIVGQRIQTLLDEDSAAALLRTGRDVLDAGRGREFSDESGGRHYHAVFEPVDADRFEVIVRDVTAVKRTEQAFHEERAFLETVIDSLTDVFFVLDLQGRLVRWNDRFEEVTGRGGAALRGADPLEFVADAEVDSAANHIEEAVEAGQTTTELVIVDGGEPVPYEVTSSLVTDDDGEPRYVCAIGRDISTRRATQAELDAAIAELERSNAELEQFAYVASHDLKEPLRMVSSYLQLLDRRYGDDLDDDAEEFIEFAVDGANRMQEMIDDLLEYSRVGRKDREFEPVDCNEVLETVQRNLGVAIDDSNATVEVGDLPTVEGDRSRLVELFQNLVSNAIRYTGSGEEPHVTVAADPDDDRWVFAVEDEGMGIPEDRIDRVFDLFYRSDVQESTGIGLALVQKIAESHGGEVRVESTTGEGSTFYVALPRHEE